MAAPLVAADVTQLASDTVNNATSTSFNSATATSATQAWSDTAAPASGNNYFTQAFLLRTLNNGGSTTFGGDSLTIGGQSSPANGALVLKNSANSTITINHLAFNGGALLGSGGGTLTLAGNVTINAGGGALGSNTNRFLDIPAAISGSGPLSIYGQDEAYGGITLNGGGTVRLQADNSGYTGIITLVGSCLSTANKQQGVLGLQHANAARSATILVNTTTTAPNPGLAFRNLNFIEIGALGGSGIVALCNTGTDRIPVTVGSNNASTTFSGTIIDASTASVVNGEGSLIKVGAGTMTLTGDNTFTYALTISGGTIALGKSGTLLGTNHLVLNGGTLSEGAGFANTLGTLDLDANSTIAVETGGTLVFADSSSQDWGTSTLSITGTFVSGSSIRFGTTNDALTANQLALINIPGFTAIDIDSNGFLTATTGGLSPLENWRVTHFGSASGSGNAANSADPDADGFANLIEYALGSNPVVSSTPSYHTQTSGGALQLVFNRVADPTLTYTVQSSSDLGSWTNIWTSSGSANLAGEVVVSDTVLLSSSPRRFMRVAITSTIP